MINPYVFGGVAVHLEDDGVLTYAPSGNAIASYTIAPNGDVIHNLTPVAKWIEQPANAALYEVRATVQFGDPGQPTGTTAAWLACTVNRTWSVSAPTNEARTVSLLIEIRRAATGIVEASAVVTINASSGELA